jgi:DNA-binding MarR family transcriptional regulator
MDSTAQRRRPLPPCPEEAVFVELLRTADALSRRPNLFLKAEKLSSAQYNVLRILRGAPDGLLSGAIAERMLTRDPDITRILNRLEGYGLVMRERQSCDRRQILVRIARRGLELLDRLDEPIRRLHRQQLGHLAAEQLRELTSLLRACRGEP